jgi:hypothetical protein
MRDSGFSIDCFRYQPAPMQSIATMTMLMICSVVSRSAVASAPSSNRVTVFCASASDS